MSLSPTPIHSTHQASDVVLLHQLPKATRHLPRELNKGPVGPAVDAAEGLGESQRPVREREADPGGVD